MTPKTQYRIVKRTIGYAVIAPRRSPMHAGHEIARTRTWRAARKIADALNASQLSRAGAL